MLSFQSCFSLRWQVHLEQCCSSRLVARHACAAVWQLTTPACWLNSCAAGPAYGTPLAAGTYSILEAGRATCGTHQGEWAYRRN